VGNYRIGRKPNKLLLWENNFKMSNEEIRIASKHLPPKINNHEPYELTTVQKRALKLQFAFNPSKTKDYSQLHWDIPSSTQIFLFSSFFLCYKLFKLTVSLSFLHSSYNCDQFVIEHTQLYSHAKFKAPTALLKAKEEWFHTKLTLAVVDKQSNIAFYFLLQLQWNEEQSLKS